MLFGPVFRYELSAVARRKRTFVVRGMYGLLLLIFFCIPLYSSGLSKAAELAHHELARLAEAFWSAVLVAQSLAVLILTPALVAGSVAQERASGKIALLLASPLSSLEIILGKLAARFADLVLILGLALPVLCLLSLMGGVDVWLVVLSDAVLLATGLLIAATAMAASTLSTRPGRAITSTYAIVAGWMSVPFLIDGARNFGTGLVGWLGRSAWSLESALGLTNPLYEFCRRGNDPRAAAWDLVLTMAVQVGLSVVLVAGSAAILRPLVRGAGPFGWRVAPLSFLLSRRRLLPRPRCGDKPMVWKECHAARTTVLFRLAAAVGVLTVAIPLGLLTWESTRPAFAELQAQGYGSVGASSAREEFNVFLRVTLVLLYILMALGITARSATSITIEKEKGTWASLLVTPMNGGEIVGGKLIGVFWGLRWLGLVYVGYLAVGLAAGAIHPLAGVYSALLTAASLAFTAALGITMSLRSRSSVAALAAALVTLLAVYILPMCGGLPFGIGSPQVLGLSLASYDDVDGFFRGAAPPPGSVAIAAILLLSLVFHAVAALAFLSDCLSRFEIDADRPRRDNPRKRRVRRA